tara:strand:+ start:26278 stop:26676 length:399 start_codon:yes stop_codon:yes gene_type:complete
METEKTTAKLTDEQRKSLRNFARVLPIAFATGQLCNFFQSYVTFDLWHLWLTEELGWGPSFWFVWGAIMVWRVATHEHSQTPPRYSLQVSGMSHMLLPERKFDDYHWRPLYRGIGVAILWGINYLIHWIFVQ